MGEVGVGGAGGVGVAGDCMVVPGACPRFPWPGLGGLLAHRLWWFRCPPVVEVAGGDADGGVLPAMVCLMPLAWVMLVLEPAVACVGFVGVGAPGDGVGEGVVLA